MPRKPAPTVRVVSVQMADGTPMDSPQAQQRIARALLPPEIRDHIPAPGPAGQAAVQQAITILVNAAPLPRPITVTVEHAENPLLARRQYQALADASTPITDPAQQGDQQAKQPA